MKILVLLLCRHPQ
ncbi:hypothetical protein FQN60_003675 [Etheostoma spectabile]|uniref:Uncharacterized protein n=1 Tax=Etheostoma spectabile TaxID=54343 RepID=A0A5J5D072_9PERO|nr:hypothetical protein FQN60_003675 [Etheostoma spectabile]